VYLDVALRQVLGFDPTKDTFTVTITGGPKNGDDVSEMKSRYSSVSRVTM
jgi:hypothetical protein